MIVVGLTGLLSLVLMSEGIGYCQAARSHLESETSMGSRYLTGPLPPPGSGSNTNLIKKQGSESRIDQREQDELIRVVQPSKPSFKVNQRLQGVGLRDSKSLTGYYFSPGQVNGAAGLKSLVSIAGAAIEIQSKLGVVLYRSALTKFFNISVSPANSSFSAFVKYDENEDRFAIGATYVDQSDFKDLALYFAVSKTGSPSGAKDWYIQAIKYGSQFNSTTKEYTYLTNINFQVGPEAMYASAARYGATAGYYYGTEVFVLTNKGNFYKGGKLSYHKLYASTYVSSSVSPSLGSQVYLISDLTPANVYGDSIGKNIGTFFVGYNGPLHTGNTSYLFVAALEDPLGTPSLAWNGFINLGEVNQALSYYGTLPDAPQLGSKTDVLYLYSALLFDVSWRNGNLWVTAQFSPFPVAGAANRTTVYWYKIYPDFARKTFTVVDGGLIGGESLGKGTFTFNPTLGVNSRGVTAIGFGASGPLIHPGAYVVGRNQDDPKGTVSAIFEVKAGVDLYDNRYWASYSGMSVDPVDDSFWVYNTYADKRFNHTSFLNATTVTWAWGTAWRRFTSTVCKDDYSSKFYVSSLKASKDCHWLAGAAHSYKQTYCQQTTKYSKSRLLCAKTCGICK